jgi:hypothetical protein
MTGDTRMQAEGKIDKAKAQHARSPVTSRMRRGTPRTTTEPSSALRNAPVSRTGGALRATGEGRKPVYRRSADPQTSPRDRRSLGGSVAYALVRAESPAEMIQGEMEQLRAILDERRPTNPPDRVSALRSIRTARTKPSTAASARSAVSQGPARPRRSTLVLVDDLPMAR